MGTLLIAVVSLQLGCLSPEAGHKTRHSAIHSTVPTNGQTQAGLAPISPRDGRSTPVIAVVGASSGTEVTDYVVPYALLSASGVADVWALGIRPGPIPMFPALTIEPQATVDAFNARFPRGADVVIVPAVHDDDDPELLSWITSQADQGATIVGICDGVWVLARAGLLSGRQGVGHWYSMGRLQKRFPETTWLRDRRFVADGRIVTTTGVTASTPVSLALVEAIAGRDKADSLARALGVRSWSPDHESDRFSLSLGHVRTAAANWLAFWGRETFGTPVFEGVDEIALALTADAYSRTYRSKVQSVAAVDGPMTTQRGLRVLPDVVSPMLIAEMEGHRADSSPGAHRPLPVASGDPVDYLVPMRSDRPVRALDDALTDITQRYGARTAAFVALQLEYTP